MTDYKLMPKQITKEMADAFWEEYSKDRADDLLMRCYRALYVTAPAPQSAEQQPVCPTCPTCYGIGWYMDCQNEFRPATCPDCVGSGKAEHSITVQESDSAAPDVAGLVEALEQILGWRELRSGREFPIERIEDIARAALAAYRKQGGES